MPSPRLIKRCVCACVRVRGRGRVVFVRVVRVCAGRGGVRF